MRRVILCRWMILAMINLMLGSCVKTDQAKQVNYLQQEPTAFTNWLNRYSDRLSGKRKDILNTLRKHFNYSGIQKINLKEGRTANLVPVKDDFLKIMKITKYSGACLLATQDASGEILRADIVLYDSEHKPYDNIAEDLENYLKSEPVSLSGSLRFLTASGDFKYEVSFGNGEPTEWKRLKNKTPKQSTVQGGAAKSYTCFEFYLVTTYYQNGVVVEETETYLGTSCYGDPSGDCAGDWESVCNPGEGGSGNSGEQFENTCCLPDPAAEVNSTNVANIKGQSCAPTYWDQGTQEWLGNCSLNWEYRRENLWVFGWQWVSDETYVRKGATANGPYTFKSISHLGNHSTGTIPPCVTVSNTITSWQYSLTNSNAKANIYLSSTSSFRIDCCLTCATAYESSTSSLNLITP